MTTRRLSDQDLPDVWARWSAEVQALWGKGGYNGATPGPVVISREMRRLGCDLSTKQWRRVLEWVKERGLDEASPANAPGIRRETLESHGFAVDTDGHLEPPEWIYEKAPPEAEELVDLLTEDGDLEDLLTRRVSAYQRKARKVAPRVHQITRDEPFAVCHFGDPHLDDDGCDFPELLKALRVVRRTPHMYGGNIGDTVNNWVGRLTALYKHQETTEDDAFRLAKWFAQAIPWDYWVLGNHDHWNQGGLVLRYILEGAKVRVVEAHEARIEYGETARIVCRHDFNGHSMWNDMHSNMKRAKLRPWGHLYVAGHRHTWGVAWDESAGSHDPVCGLRVRGFKRFDDYAQAKDFSEDQHGAHLTTVHNPVAPHPGERLKVFHDVELAADYLGWIRKREGL